MPYNGVILLFCLAYNVLYPINPLKSIVLIMKNFFGKSIIVALIVMMACTNAFAQKTGSVAKNKGKMAIGASLNIGNDSDFTNFGLGVKFQYGIMDKIRVEPSFNYYFKADNISMWDLSLNGHYLIPIKANKKLTVYPIGGLALVGTKFSYTSAPTIIEGIEIPGSEVDITATNLGINAGCGIEYILNSKISINGEVKYQIVEDYNRPIISGGINYKL